jgi:hypothetical protein
MKKFNKSWIEKKNLEEMRNLNIKEKLKGELTLEQKKILIFYMRN